MAGKIGRFGGIVNDGLILYLYTANKDSYTESSSTIVDLSSKNKDGTLVNDPPMTDDGLALDFNGSSHDCDWLNSLSNLDLNKGTLSLVAKVNAGIYLKTFVSIRKDSSYNIAIYGNASSEMAFKYKTVGLKETSTPFTANTDTYRFLDLTYDTDADELKGYIDGVQIGSTITGLGSWVGSPIYMKIGQNGTGNAYPTMDFAQFRAYDRALTEEEILQNYNALKSRYGL